MLLAPSTLTEYRTMIGLSFVAGICEEIVYRGFLFWFFSSHMSPIPTIIMVNVLFALTHLTATGRKNAIYAFVMGLIYTAAFIVTESLWLSILLHIITDIYAATQSYKVAEVLGKKVRNAK